MKRRIAIATILLLLAASGAARADGFIVVRPPFPPASPTPFPLEVIYHHVEVEIEGRFAITEIDQKFYNPTNSRIEGFYLFPVPEGAVFEEFSLELGGVEMEAELLDAEEARRIYEDIVRQARDPALLEYVGRELYKLRVFPIEPKSELPMRIVYREALPEENLTIEYVYPLNTEKFSAKPLENVSVVVEIEREGGVENVYCPTHEVDVVRKSDDRVVVSYEERRVKPDIDFKLYYGVGDGAFDLTLLSTKPAGEDGYFFLSLAPDYDDGKSPPVEKDVTFVFDVSGSMKGERSSKRARRSGIASASSARATDSRSCAFRPRRAVCSTDSSPRTPATKRRRTRSSTRCRPSAAPIWRTPSASRSRRRRIRNVRISSFLLPTVSRRSGRATRRS